MEARPNLSGSSIVSSYMKTGGLTTVRIFREKENGKDIDIIGSFSSVPEYNWGVIIQIEKDIAFAPVMKMIRESMIWGTLFALVAALLGFQFARWITNPIQVLAQHALNIGRNQNFDQKIEIKASNEIQQLADTFNYMTDEIKQKILSLEAAAQENKELFFSSIRMLAAAIDAKDPYTRGHSERVKDYSMVIGKELGLNETELERLEIVALLHDVGKIGIEDRILRKPTNLTPEEFEIMKTHPDKGANIMSQVAQLSDVIPGMRAHHENYDGSGYPQGLKGEDIPFFARLITVADTFDAMTTDRPYQKAFTLEFAVNRIRQMSGIKYDPKIVEAFANACQEGRLTLAKPSRPRPKQAVG
jgi:HD-GYP domain-containing protein (c-di-GMP phosphodiesterase class II)